jgi:hypothetical protein
MHTARGTNLEPTARLGDRPAAVAHGMALVTLVDVGAGCGVGVSLARYMAPP